MSHFPAGQPYNSGTGWTGAGFTNDLAVSDVNTLLDGGLAVDFSTITNANVQTLFTTQAGRGRFLPLFMLLEVDDATAAAGSTANLNVGWDSTSPTNPYAEFTDGFLITSPATTFTARNYETVTLSVSAGAKSAPASTAIRAYMRVGSGGTKSLRTVALLGVYAG